MAASCVLAAPPVNAGAETTVITGTSGARFDSNGKVTGSEGSVLLQGRLQTEDCFGFAEANGQQHLNAASNRSDRQAVLYKENQCSGPVRVLPPDPKTGKLVATPDWRSIRLTHTPPALTPSGKLTSTPPKRSTGAVQLWNHSDVVARTARPALDLCIDLTSLQQGSFFKAEVYRAGTGVLHAYTDTTCGQGHQSVNMNTQGATLEAAWNSIKVTRQ
ncbi:hypothetical protein [Actinomadura fulvescens]|uniref:hypothetical protein n=1 Tax=Actinomadura fulvescens TaxID=46160 RepID=UPI0031D91990